MSIKSYSPVSAVASVLLAAIVVPSAWAASPPADRGPAKVAEAQQVGPTTVADTDEEPANCNRSRKRLWLEGEGWVVRKVTTCR